MAWRDDEQTGPAAGPAPAQDDEAREAAVVEAIMAEVRHTLPPREANGNSRKASNGSLSGQIPAVIFIQPVGNSHESPYVSASVEKVFGCTADDWLKSSWWDDHLYPDDREIVHAARQTLLLTGSSSRIEYRMSTADGRLIWISELSQVVTSAGKPWMLQGLLEDITARKLTEDHLAFQAAHDSLTGLPNRATFENHLQRALARALRGRLAVVVLFIDINNFRAVNERVGHEAGDEVLREVSRRLSEAIRETDVVARRGADEFLVLLADIEPGPAGWPDDDSDDADPVSGVADMVSDRIRHALEQPVTVQGVSIEASVSIGRSIYPVDAADFRTILGKAFADMHRAKQASAQNP